MDAGRRIATLDGFMTGDKCWFNALLAVRCSRRQRRHFDQLLLGESHPVFQLGIELRFRIEVDGRVDERAGRSDL